MPAAAGAAAGLVSWPAPSRGGRQLAHRRLGDANTYGCDVLGLLVALLDPLD